MNKLAILAALSLSALAACSPAPRPGPGADTATRMQFAETGPLPATRSFAPAHASGLGLPELRMSNADIANDFLDLHFEMESGRRLETLTRFETPITVRLTGQTNALMASDLRALLGRLRSEAGIDIRQVPAGQTAMITIQAVPRAEIRRTMPTAACFVVPNVDSLADYRRNKRSQKTNWAALRSREKMGIFVPADVSPQETRDCLHEELAQSLGPLNDLYRLSQSVYNDDNVYTVLTGFDMLILRATYAPELHTGMTRDQVAAVLPDVLDRLNPAGRGLPAHALSPTPRNWINDVQTALGPGSSAVSRQRAAADALRIADRMQWQDHRRAFSHYMMGRMSQTSDPAAARRHFETAAALLARVPGTELHRAYIATQTAAYDIARGDGRAALSDIGASVEVAARYQNASLMATLMLMKAEALDLTGRGAEAQSLRLDSLGWARYGFGSDRAVREKMAEIAALRPQVRG